MKVQTQRPACSRKRTTRFPGYQTIPYNKCGAHSQTKSGGLAGREPIQVNAGVWGGCDFSEHYHCKISGLQRSKHILIGSLQASKFSKTSASKMSRSVAISFAMALDLVANRMQYFGSQQFSNDLRRSPYVSQPP